MVDQDPALATRPVWLDRFFVLFSMEPRRSSESSGGPQLHPAKQRLDGIELRRVRPFRRRSLDCSATASGRLSRSRPRSTSTFKPLGWQRFRKQTVAGASTCAALSSNLIALAFIGQMSRLGTAFYAFALILLPVLAFMGAVTFQRLVQSSIEDIAYAERIARLRAFYLGLAPEARAVSPDVHGPRAEGLLHDKRLGPSTWQLMLTTAGMVGVVNSAVIGACAGLAVETLSVVSFAVVLMAGSPPGW